MDGSRFRKEKVADSKISGYMWTGPQFVTFLFIFLHPRAQPPFVHFGDEEKWRICLNLAKPLKSSTPELLD